MVKTGKEDNVEIKEQNTDMNVNNLIYFRMANSNNLMKMERLLKRNPEKGVNLISMIQEMDN